MFLLIAMLLVASLVTFVWASVGVYSGRLNLIAVGLALVSLVMLIKHVS